MARLHQLVSALVVVVVAASAHGVPVVAAAAAAGEPNPPKWPSTVRVFDPADTDIASVVQAAYKENGGHTPPNNGQFSSARFAFLFKPGTYTVEVPVGFYTTVAGLGLHPDDVVFASAKGVYCEEGDYVADAGALDTFWRSAENFRTSANFSWTGDPGMLWAVSQASPLRRIHVDNDLTLFEYVPPYPNAGYSSGGFMADCQVGGKVTPGSQQQWFARNSAVSGWDGGVWNFVFAGVTGAPNSHCSDVGDGPYTTVGTAPVTAEKPFITIDAGGKFQLQVPAAQNDTKGTAWDAPKTSIDFASVYVATAADSAANINAKLAAGLHLVLSPGLYSLEAPLLINTANQVVLGLGLATLISANGTPVLQVGNVDGVRISGLLLQAGPKPTPALLQWGDGTHPGSAGNPGLVQDVFARVGGPDHFAVQADIMFNIESGHVIGDNMWLWRADHTVDGAVKGSANPCLHGLRVTGDHVTMYGLAVEHTLRDLVQWSGDHGQTFFFQSELPYDVTQEQFGDPGYVGYRVNSSVTAHSGYGIGVYHFFRDANVTVASGISCPAAVEKDIVAPLSVFLNGRGTMTHVINSQGNPTGWAYKPMTSYVC